MSPRHLKPVSKPIGLGSAKGFRNAFLRSGGRLEIGIFGLVRKRLTKAIDEAVEGAKITGIASLDRTLDLMVAGDTNGVRSEHGGKLCLGLCEIVPSL